MRCACVCDVCVWCSTVCVCMCVRGSDVFMVCVEAEDIKKRWQEYTEGLYKKDLNDPDNHYGVITHLEPDILE